MNLHRDITALVSGLAFILMPFIASAASLSIQSLSPTTTITAKTIVSFSVVPSGFVALTYGLSDSFGTTSSASIGNVDPSGKFSWVPLVGDVGTHILTVTASDNASNTASTTQTITVQPPPSLSIQSPSGTSVMPGAKFTFTVSATGFTNPTYIIGDSFGGSSVKNTNMDATGNFEWKPDQEQVGMHTITI